MDANGYLSALFGEKPDDAFFHFWQKNKEGRKGGKTQWFRDLDSASEFAEKNPEDLYVGMGLTNKSKGPYKRPEEKDVIGIPALYADIDVAKVGSHKKGNLPQNINQAMDLVNQDPLPSMIVNSGYGLHVYWIFKEPWIFDSEDERDFAKNINMRIGILLKARAKQFGWSIDSVFDLSRLLRPVGTLNCKLKEQQPVKMVTYSGITYTDAEYFDQVCPQITKTDLEKVVTPEEIKLTKQKIGLNKNAEPPAGKLDMLCEIDTKFKATWMRQRPDMDDQTTSGYHMSLAIFAFMAGWTQQEVADLIIGWNRRHGYDMEKPMRPTYMATTIEKAKKRAGDKKVGHYEENVLPTIDADEQYGITEQNTKATLAYLEQKLGIKILRIIKFKDEDEAQYLVETPKGNAHFKNTDAFLSLAKFRSRLYSATSHQIAVTSPKIWRNNIVPSFKYVMVEEELTSDNTIKGRASKWLYEYLESKSLLSAEEGLKDLAPFEYKGHWFIYKETFRNFAFTHQHFLGSMRDISLYLRMAGCKEKKMTIQTQTTASGKTSRTVWRVPKSIIKPEQRLKAIKGGRQ